MNNYSLFITNDLFTQMHNEINIFLYEIVCFTKVVERKPTVVVSDRLNK